MKCEIQWIDENGKPTPDDNEAVGYAWMEAHDVQSVTGMYGSHMHLEESKHYLICAEHLKRIPKEHWCFESFDGLYIMKNRTIGLIVDGVEMRATCYYCEQGICEHCVVADCAMCIK